MSVIQNFTQYDGEHFLEVFLRPAVGKLSLQQQGIRVFEGPKSRLNLYYAGEYDKVTRLNAGCGWNPSTQNVNVTSKHIPVKALKAEDQQCFDAFLQTAWEYALKQGKEIGQLENTDIDVLLQSIFVPVIERDIHRIMWLGDTALIGNPAYNMLDGYLKLIGLGVSGSTIVNHTITSMTTPTDAYNALLAVYNNQPLRMKSKQEKVILVTRNIYDLYVTYLTTVSGVDGSFTLLMNGLPQVFFRGIEVLPLDTVQHYLQTDFTNFNNGRIIMTVREEGLVAAFDTTDINNKFESWYERKDNMQMYRAQWTMGVELHWHELFSVGGF